MKRDFYVLVIDDKEEVCRRMREKLPGRPALNSRPSAHATAVTCKTVHVALQRRSEKELHWTFAPTTWRALKEAADRAPDLIIIDYIYVDSLAAERIKARGREEEVGEKLVEGVALNPGDLKRWILESPHIPESARKSISRRIFNTHSPVYLHSYTPEGLTAVVGSVADRKRKLQQVFPRAEVTLVDTRSELFSNDEFDWPNPDSKWDRNYYPYQLAVYFDQVTKFEIVQERLRRHRYLRVRRTVGSVAVISAIGAGIGFAAAWIGALVGEITRTGATLTALVVGAGFVVVLLILGSICPFLFEALMGKIMTPPLQDDEA